MHTTLHAKETLTEKNRNSAATEEGTYLRRNFAEVPYTFDFTLSVFARNMDDGLQIVEQILPFFTPEFTVTMKINDLNTSIDVPIVINSVSQTDEYDGDLETTRLLTFDINFTAKSYVYGPIKEGKVIKDVIVTNFLSDFTTTGGITGATAHYPAWMLASQDPVEQTLTLLQGSLQIHNFMFVVIQRDQQESHIDVLGNTI